jgi:hypothetical protein
MHPSQLYNCQKVCGVNSQSSKKLKLQQKSGFCLSPHRPSPRQCCQVALGGFPQMRSFLKDE